MQYRNTLFDSFAELLSAFLQFESYSKQRFFIKFRERSWVTVLGVGPQYFTP